MPTDQKYKGWDIYYLEPNQRPVHLEEYKYLIMKHPMAMSRTNPKTLPHYVKSIREAKRLINEIERR